MLRIGLEGLVVETASCPPAHRLTRAREPGNYDRKHPDKRVEGFEAAMVSLNTVSLAVADESDPFVRTGHG
jgi:hypothetical protein